MSSEPQRNLTLEIAHVLFMDLVGYSKLLIDQQSDLSTRLNQIVRGTEQFGSAEAAGKLVRLPTGDGMALAFFTSPDAPVRCAREISEALRSQPDMRLRMGIHSGPVDAVRDVNDRTNVAGAGINMAQRVMNCGDAGHILLSQRVADDLSQSAEWQPHLQDLGEFEVKHGVRIGVVNFCSEGVGNSELPEKLRRLKKLHAAGLRRRRMAWALALLVVVGALAFGFWFQGRRVARAVSSAPDISEKSIAVLPLENLSEDKENAFFADGIQDDVLNSLAKIAALKVISRTSVMQYRGSKRSTRDIGDALHVSYLLEGSAQKANGRLRLSAQLINTRTDAHIWAEQYDRELSDVFAIQSELAQKIVTQLKANLSHAESSRSKTPNAEHGSLRFLSAGKGIAQRRECRAAGEPAASGQASGESCGA